MPHDHHHLPSNQDNGAAARRALTLALILNGGFLLVEATVGWLTGSLALLSDAAHMLSDVAALSIALSASHLARRAADATRTFGLRRAEPVGAFVNALIMLLVCGYIFWEAFNRLALGPPEVPGWPILVVGSIGLAINVGSAWLLYRADRDNLNVRGALVHMAADALGSLGAMVAACFCMAGFPAADAIVSLLIGMLVLWGTWGLLRDSARVLLEFAPAGLKVEDVRAAICAVEGVEDVHDLHVWTLDGSNRILTAHLVLCGPKSPAAVRKAVEHLLHDTYRVGHTTLQLEGIGECAARDCALGTGNVRTGLHAVR